LNEERHERFEMIEKLQATISGSLAVAAKSFGIWFVSWAIRRKGEFDYKLDRTARLTRWSIVAISFAVVTRFPSLSLPRALSLTVGLAFLVWPNFAYHLTNLFRSGSRPQDDA
jgi:hypothetical protein